MKLMNRSKIKLHSKRSCLFSIYPKRNIASYIKENSVSKMILGRLKDQDNKRHVTCHMSGGGANTSSEIPNKRICRL